MTRDEIQAESNAMHILLDQSDYEVIKAIEAFLTAASDATGVIGFVSAVKSAIEGITQLLSDRATWRARINELDAMEPEDEGGTSEA